MKENLQELDDRINEAEEQDESPHQNDLQKYTEEIEQIIKYRVLQITE